MTEGTRPPVSVIVPTRNRAGLLPSLLSALDKQDYPRYETIVVDDASTDTTPALLGIWEGENHTVIRLDSPSGSYAARNAGWKAAGGDIVAFTDDDCIPEPGWISALVQALNRPDVVGVQGMTVTDPENVTPFTHQIVGTTPGPPYRTCNIAYRRSLSDSIGPFDETLRWYADNIFGLRARESGRIAFAPDAVVRHPPRPREWRDRQTWLARFDADAVHRRYLNLSGLEPPIARGVLPIVLWILRPLLKQSGAHLRYCLQHPAAYLGGIRPMLREKLSLVAALWEYLQRSPSRRAYSTAREALPPLPPQPLVSVVIVTRTGRGYPHETVDAVLRQTWAHREVVIVEHGGSELSPHPRVGEEIRVVSALCGGLGVARQVGVEDSRGEIVAFTDDDCIPGSRWLEAAVNRLKEQPELWGCGGRTVAQHGPIDSHAISVGGPDPLHRTCNIAYRRHALDAVGGFDRRFLGWFEDTALGARIEEHGPIGFSSGMFVLHRAVPRRELNRREWGILLEDERRLADLYPDFYRRTRGPGFLPTVLARWLIGSPLKTLWRERRWVTVDPIGYIKLVLVLGRERFALVCALRDLTRARR